ncbi:hypothetical protein Pan241w_50700 [Gimesia alba]|uniref:Uncharacterized protein n=1 Tax=Gimesia alba TaxID=2527973 RepID=A0A517RM38_9PLAN|nr:hypothetical protein [Gimesia alba]QDT44953.1 hypothetical protein Pan241w_50700 [Gimesia alba]
MENINLNLGGVIGAIVCGGIAAAIIFSTVDLKNGKRPQFQLITLGLIGGAFVGNYLWGRIFKKPEIED